MKHKQNTLNVETQVLAFWRQLDDMFKSAGEDSPQFGEVSALFSAGYSVTQAARVLAPAVDFHRIADRRRAVNF